MLIYRVNKHLITARLNFWKITLAVNLFIPMDFEHKNIGIL